MRKIETDLAPPHLDPAVRQGDYGDPHIPHLAGRAMRGVMETRLFRVNSVLLKN